MASREEALASFDDARRLFVGAYADVPNEALAFLVPGEDYALGGLVVHANAVLDHYHFVLEAVVGGGFATVRAVDPPGFWEQAAEAAKAGLTPAERAGVFAGLDARHARFVDAVGAVPEADWGRKAEGVYGDAQEPYPTSPEDILGWLIAHYLEHVPQVSDLHRAWQDAS